MKSIGLKLVCGLALLLGTSNGQAQVDSMLHNGEYVYIYPFKKEVKIHADYWELVDDKEFFLDYNNYFDLFSGNFMFERESFQNAKTSRRKKELQKELADSWKRILRGRGFGPGLTKSLRKQPGELLIANYEMGQDLLPPFGNIPNGKYVQLFETFCVVDEKGNCQSDVQRIAGIFDIKNNALDGHAVWLNFNGDTLKTGNFVNGLKEGEWLIKETDELSQNIYRWQRRMLRDLFKNEYARDTVYTYTHFVNGVEHGPYRAVNNSYGSKVFGQFDRGEASGEWTQYSDDILIERLRIADHQDTVISHKPLLRGTRMQYPRSYYGRTKKKDRLVMFPSIYSGFPENFYSINYGKFKDARELEGETEQSFELTDGRNSEYYNSDHYGYEGEHYGSYLDEKEVDPITRQTIARWYAIDSLGMRMNYDGVYERYHYNGQRFFRYEFVDGHLLREDTLFWDNGVAHDVIVFQPDSNKFYRNLYDRNGKHYDQMIYDSLGAFIRFESDKEYVQKTLEIDGLPAKEMDYSAEVNFGVDGCRYYYEHPDGIKRDSMVEPILLLRTWSSPDTTQQMNIDYDPVSRTYKQEFYNYFGESVSTDTRVFTPTFSGWNGTTITKFDGFTVNQTRSGVLIDDVDLDSLGHKSVNYSNYFYDITSDEMLYAGEEPYTGVFSLAYRSGFSGIKSSKGKINVSIQKGFFGSRKYRRKLRAEGGNEEMLRYVINGASSNFHAFHTYGTFIDFFDELVYSREEFSWYNVDESFGGMKKLKGEFLDGKPHGVWTAYSNRGKVISTLNFINGEPEGELRIYDEQEPERKRRYGYDRFMFEELLDTFPPRKTEYLKCSSMFKNGMREGRTVQYDWLGRITTDMFFENGLAEGEFMMRDYTYFSKATFKFGRLDGYLRTYLTLPNMDTLLLYDINLQHGLLNGESRAYHTNGSLAKRGFFLDNEPIDDYEAYDTLGFKFHYVKFQYSHPVEEKIWEENALSIRYQFNWEDSIPFSPDELTESESFKSLLARNGYYHYSANERYYGRPTLVPKDDIECRMTKYYPNDTIARDGMLADKRKIGLWKFYGYNGNFLYEANYFDSVIVINDSIQFKSKGILTDYDDKGNRLYSAYIIEKFEKYDCAHTDHYEIRQLLTIDEVDDSLGRMNGYVQNFYDNGTIQGEGTMKNGLPDGLWKFYDPFGKLNKMGNYVMGKRNGRWLEGDLAKKKYLGEICMNPNLDNLEEMQKYQENLLDITIINYMMGKVKNVQYYDVNMNRVQELEESREED